MTDDPDRPGAGLSDRSNLPLAAGVLRLSALLLAIVISAILVIASPDPAASGLRPIAPERIQVFEPGEGHQARSLASANWSLDFADQFRFDAETARQRAAGIGGLRISPTERQWHFELTEAESRGAPLALFIANAAGAIDLNANGSRLATGMPQPPYFGPGIGGAMLATPINARAIFFEGNRIDLIQSDDAGHVGIRAVFMGSPTAVEAAQRAFTRWLDRQRLGAGIGAMIGLIAALALLITGRRRVTAGALAVLAGLQVLALTGTGTAAQPAWLWPAASAVAAAAIAVAHLRPNGVVQGLVFGLSLPAMAGGIAGLVLTIGTWLPPQPFQLLALANEGARPLLLLGGAALLWEVGRAMLARMHAVRLELQHKDRIIARQQAALETELRNAAILEERQRFARDMHDGIGGHLQSLLMRVRAKRIEPTDIAAELQSGLADLRLMVDSLDQIDTALDQALANFRMRAAPQLDAAGIALHWQMAEAIATVRLDPQATLSLYRIFQELVTNCVRHSAASTMTITISLSADRAAMTARLTDDGRGFDPAMIKPGNGLANLRQRAARLGGSIAFSRASPTGTEITLSLPVEPTLAS